MAFFATGNQGWDQGLNTLAGSLFPDPSKQAQAGLYGAETAKTLLDAQRLRDEKGYRDQLADYYKLRAVNPGAAPSTPPPAPGAPPPLANTIAPLPTAPAPTASAAPGPVMGAAPAPAPAPAPTPVPTLAAPAAAPRAGAAPAAGGPMAGFSIPQLVALSTLSGNKSPETALMARSELVNRARTGQIPNDAMLNREQSALGDSTPLTEAGQTQRTGMTVGGNIAVEKLREAGQTERLKMGTQILYDTVTQQNVPVPLADLLANPGRYRQTVSKDSFAPTASVPGKPTSPPVNTPVTQMGGTTPYDETGARAGAVPAPYASDPNDPASTPRYGRTDDLVGRTPSDRAMVEADSKPVDVVSPDGKTITTTTYGQWKANPRMGRLATSEDIKYSTVIGPGQRLMSGPRAAMGGAAPVPETLEQLNARNAARVSGATESGQPSVADTIVQGMQTGSQAVAPRTAMSVDDERKAKELGALHFAKVMYPAGSGLSPLSSTAPAVPGDQTQAYHDKLVMALQRGEYKNNPGAAEIEAYNIMRRDGILTEKPETREVGVNFTGAYAKLIRSVDGKTQRIVVNGDFSRIPKDANGDPIVQVPAPSRPTQVTRPNTATPAQPPAPQPRPPVVDQGKPLGPAPGLPDGPFQDKTTGISYIVRGGQLYAAPAP